MYMYSSCTAIVQGFWLNPVVHVQCMHVNVRIYHTCRTMFAKKIHVLVPYVSLKNRIHNYNYWKLRFSPGRENRVFFLQFSSARRLFKVWDFDRAIKWRQHTSAHRPWRHCDELIERKLPKKKWNRRSRSDWGHCMKLGAWSWAWVWPTICMHCPLNSAWLSLQI